MIEMKKSIATDRTINVIFMIFVLCFSVTLGGLIAVKESTYLVAFIGAIAYFIATVKYPEMALALFLAINYVAALQPYTGFGMTRVLGGAVVVSSGYYVGKSMKAGRCQIKIDSLQIANLLFTSWVVINLLGHTDWMEGYGFLKLGSYLLYSLIPFYAITIFQNDLIRIERFAYFYVFGLAVATGLCLVFFGNSLIVQEQLVKWGRFFIFGDPINYSLPFVSGVIMAVYLYSKPKARYYKIAVLLCMCEFTYVLILSGTRQSIMATIFGAMLFSCLIMKQKRLIVPIIIFSASLWFFYSNLEESLLLNRYLQMLDFSAQSAQQRFVDYHASFDLFLQFPVVGVGLGEYGRYKVPGELSAHTHNLFLEILAEQGVVGFCLFIGFLWLPMGKAFYIMRKLGSSDSRYALTCLFFSIIIAELFRSNFSGGIGSITILWFAVGALWVIATSKYQLKNRSNSARNLK